jgi:hypothetical protein
LKSVKDMVAWSRGNLAERKPRFLWVFPRWSWVPSFLIVVFNPEGKWPPVYLWVNSKLSSGICSEIGILELNNSYTIFGRFDYRFFSPICYFSSFSPMGSFTMKVLPFPTSLSNSVVPSCFPIGLGECQA